MEREKLPQIELEIVECEICLKEVPVSAATSEEAQDYVAYFCGIDCFARWKQQQEESLEEK